MAAPGTGTPYSPQLAVSAGRAEEAAALPTLYADAMYISYWLQAVSPGDDSTIHVEAATPDASQASSFSMFFKNTPAGLFATIEEQINAGVLESSTVPDGGVGWDAGMWHFVEMNSTFDGVSDAWNLFVDGVSYGTFIAFFDYATILGTGTPYMFSNRLKFRTLDDPLR
jgi:hypothetical protein